MPKKIYLSPANHNGENVCKFSSSCRESIHCRAIALSAERYLRANGFSVKVRETMRDGRFLPSQTMAKAVMQANAWGCDLYIPIHTNASSNPNARYVMFMTLNKTAQKYKTAYEKIGKTIHAEYSSALQEAGIAANAPRWVASDDLYEINAPNALSFYLELGFHTNKAVDCALFIHRDNGAYAGKAIAKGICAYYGVSFNDPDVSAAPDPVEPLDPAPAEPTDPDPDLPLPEPLPDNDDAPPSAPPSDGSQTDMGAVAFVVAILGAIAAFLFSLF